MLLRFDPFRELDQVAASFWGDRAPVMPFDAVHRGDEVIASFDLPGIDPDTLEVRVERNVLTIEAERPSDHREGDEVLAAERRHGSFSRRLLLGDSLDPDQVAASYDRGVLTVTIPVKQQAKPRKIPVAAGGASEAIEARATEAS